MVRPDIVQNTSDRYRCTLSRYAYGTIRRRTNEELRGYIEMEKAHSYKLTLTQFRETVLNLIGRLIALTMLLGSCIPRID